MKHKKIQESLVEKGELTFDKAIDHHVATGTAREQKEGNKPHKRKHKQTHVQQRQETDEIEMQQLQSQV